MPVPLNFHPPLANSACPWATDLSHLQALLECPSTGAVTTRTSLLNGFDHQPSRHRFTFFNPSNPRETDGESYSYPDDKGGQDRSEAKVANHTASLNNLGYSPMTLQEYLDMIRQLAIRFPNSQKTFIISVTGPPLDIAACYSNITALVEHVPFPLAMEINLSCPNIPGPPPPAYDATSLRGYLAALPGNPAIPIGIKTPPYTHEGQYKTLFSALEDLDSEAESKLSFITATNTLGSCLLVDPNSMEPILPEASAGIGGMAGPPLHPLALGNVATIRRLLDKSSSRLQNIAIVGVGGVSDGGGYRRMRAAGAAMVAVGTGLGSEGVEVFGKIERQLGSSW